jgi:hypothetical protein
MKKFSLPYFEKTTYIEIISKQATEDNIPHKQALERKMYVKLT